jgi:hypothetical protein
MQRLSIDTQSKIPPTHDLPAAKKLPEELPAAKAVRVHPSVSGGENASIYWIGNATAILSVQGTPTVHDLLPSAGLLTAPVHSLTENGREFDY